MLSHPQQQRNVASLKNNLFDLAKRYQQDIIVVEYTKHKIKVNDIAFNLPNKRGKDPCIWEPLNTWEYFVEKDGSTNKLINLYQQIAKKYQTK